MARRRLCCNYEIRDEVQAGDENDLDEAAGKGCSLRARCRASNVSTADLIICSSRRVIERGKNTALEHVRGREERKRWGSILGPGPTSATRNS